MFIEEDDRKILWLKLVDIPNLIGTIIALVFFVVSNFVPVNPLYFPPNDDLSSFPYPGKETISTIVCAVIVFVVGLVVILAGFFLSLKFRRFFKLSNPFTAVYVLVTTVAVSNICVNVFKGYVGRPRPDFYARCGNSGSFENCPGLSKKELKDEFKSFPSGHSVTAMSGSIYTALFFQKCVKSRQLWVSLVSSLFLLLGFYIGMTRIRDYRHHTDDVLAGFFVGLVFAGLCWWRSHKDIFPKNKSSKVDNQDQVKP